MAAEERTEPKLVRRLRAQRAAHLRRPRVIRWLWIAVGFAILAGGVVMLVTPGPAFVLIPIGLAILSLEFLWAERLLERSLEEAEKAKRRAAETTTTQRVLTGLVTALAIGGVVAWAILGDIPVVPV